MRSVPTPTAATRRSRPRWPPNSSPLGASATNLPDHRSPPDVNGHRTLVIACGALARELLAIVELNGLDQLEIECLPAALHNRPNEIPDAVRERIERARRLDDPYGSIFVAYADCGTGGLLRAVCDEAGVEMLAGAHCYQFFATSSRFAELQDDAIGSFYLTDFLVRHFDRMVWQGLGLDRHPELATMYFGNYTRLVYLAQSDDPALGRRAREAADRLGLDMVVEHTGYGELAETIVAIGAR